jgi:hypothetical protein
MQMVEQIEVTGKSSEKSSQPKKFGCSVNIRPLTSVLPTVSPIGDLISTTNRLRRADRIYGAANIAAVGTLAASLVDGFALYVSVF